MPMIISGYIAVRTDTLRQHRGHDIGIADTVDGRLAIHCDACGVILEAEPAPITSLPCGCRNAADHAEGVALQEGIRGARYARGQKPIPRSTCVGCYIGDDGPSVHSCAIHPEGAWA